MSDLFTLYSDREMEGGYPARAIAEHLMMHPREWIVVRVGVPKDEANRLEENPPPAWINTTRVVFLYGTREENGTQVLAMRAQPVVGRGWSNTHYEPVDESWEY